MQKNLPKIVMFLPESKSRYVIVSFSIKCLCKTIIWLLLPAIGGAGKNLRKYTLILKTGSISPSIWYWKPAEACPSLGKKSVPKLFYSDRTNRSSPGDIISTAFFQAPRMGTQLFRLQGTPHNQSIPCLSHKRDTMDQQWQGNPLPEAAMTEGPHAFLPSARINRLFFGLISGRGRYSWLPGSAEIVATCLALQLLPSLTTGITDLSCKISVVETWQFPRKSAANSVFLDVRYYRFHGHGKQSSPFVFTSAF